MIAKILEILGGGGQILSIIATHKISIKWKDSKILCIIFVGYGPGDGCDVKCAGDSGQYCGGHWRNQVYVRGDLGAYKNYTVKLFAGL